MKVTLTKDQFLRIHPESDVEEYALQMWLQNFGGEGTNKSAIRIEPKIEKAFKPNPNSYFDYCRAQEAALRNGATY